MVAAKSLAADGIIHRDLKPANIMISRQDSVKVLDFGLAKLVERHPEEDWATRTVVGTIAYMSPDQAAGKPLDVRIDVFSFGAVLRDAPPPVQSVRHDFPPDLCRILDRCLEKNRDERCRSGTEVHADLVACRER